MNHSYLSAVFSCNIFKTFKNLIKGIQKQTRKIFCFPTYFFDAHDQKKINFTFCINQQILSRISILKLIVFFMN